MPTKKLLPTVPAAKPPATAPAVTPKPSTKAKAKVAPAPVPTPKSAPSVDLALQGGGSHGAFTWGVLDALLEDGRIAFEGVSGTSAGAMNAAVLACGYARGGRAGARTALRAFWDDISAVPGSLGSLPHVNGGPGGSSLTKTMAGALPALWSAAASASPFAAIKSPTWPAALFNLDQVPLYGVMDAWWKSLSPYQFNPLNINPLRKILERHLDVALLVNGPLKVYVTATAVSTGQPKVFSGTDLSIDALLASACLPQLNQAVTIDGEAYWDGGFAGNPSIWPLIYGTDAVDVLLVQINPLVRKDVPKTALDIADRLNEITFNASLVAEMRAISFVQKLIDQHKITDSSYKSLRMHRVADEAGLAPFDASSKLNTDPRLLQTLFDLGRKAGQQWLSDHAADVGVRSSMAIDPVFLAPRG